MEKDVALISLANVLHRARLSHEAAVVVHAALDVSRELNVNHFTLGNIYAVSIATHHTPLYSWKWLMSLASQYLLLVLYNVQAWIKLLFRVTC